MTAIRIPDASPDMPTAAARGDGAPFPFEVAYEGWRIYADSAEEILSVLVEGYAGQHEQTRWRARLGIAAKAQATTQRLLNAGELFDRCTEEEALILLHDPSVPPVVEEWRCGVPLVLVTCFYQPLGDLPQPMVTSPGQIWWIDPSTDQSLLKTLNGVRWLDFTADVRAGQPSRNPAYADPPTEGSTVYQRWCASNDEPRAVAVSHPLDNPVLGSLSGAHARFAERCGNVLRYRVDVAPFLAMADDPDEADWADAASLAWPGGLLWLAGLQVPPSGGWEAAAVGEGVQMTGERLEVAADPEAVPLGRSDVPEMLDLTARTRPGPPFLARTPELGTYLGIRRHGKLVAMAGERLHPEGWSEISAVCTDDAWRGQGLATRLIRAVGAAVRARGEIPFLNAVATNPAIALYEQLGFRYRRPVLFATARVPQAPLPGQAG